MHSDMKKAATRATRRNFLKRSACLTAAACCAPAIVPSSILGATAPSNRITVGMIGMGNQSTVDLPAFLEQDDVQMLAVCDVNTASHGYRTPDQFLGRKPGQDAVNTYYAKKTGAAQYKGCEAYNDFREVLGRDDVQAVVIIVPDHWHAIMTVMAANAGKDIYCEKPLSLTVSQGQKMVEAVRRHKRVLQTGSMYRSSPLARFCCELVRNGRIGQLKSIFTEVAVNNFQGPGPGWKPMPVPEGFDYKTWLGPAPAAPYHAQRCFYQFRFISDYSGGQTTNFGAHSNGLAQWANGSDGSGPVEFEDLGAEFPLPGDLFTTPTKIDFRARYANGVELHCQTTKEGFGIRLEGTEGWLQFGYKGLNASNPAILESKIGPDEIHLAVSNPSRAENNAKYYSPDHVRNFIQCVKSREDPVESVEIGNSTANLCHLGNIAMTLHRKIRWDPAKQEIIGDDEAAQMLSRPMWAPWTMPAVT
jgi:hypothetical protein